MITEPVYKKTNTPPTPQDNFRDLDCISRLFVKKLYVIV